MNELDEQEKGKRELVEFPSSWHKLSSCILRTGRQPWKSHLTRELLMFLFLIYAYENISLLNECQHKRHVIGNTFLQRILNNVASFVISI